jgi:hypothetical protein
VYLYHDRRSESIQLISNDKGRSRIDQKLFILCQSHGKMPSRVRGKNSADQVGVEMQFSRILALLGGLIVRI